MSDAGLVRTVAVASQITEEPGAPADAPPGGETAADVAEPPDGPGSGLWRRIRRSRLGVAWLLPVLLLAAAYVASPFAGTNTHAIDQPTTSAPPAATSPYAGHGR